MLKAAGDAGAMWVTEVCNSVVKEGKIPEEWCKSWMVNVYKSKGDALECGTCQEDPESCGGYVRTEWRGLFGWREGGGRRCGGIVQPVLAWKNGR